MALQSVTDPAHRDFRPFNHGTQPLVEAAFISVALLRCPPTVWSLLDSKTRDNVINALNDARSVRPHFNNWLLFSAALEAFFCRIGAEWDSMRVDYALRQHEQWYLGDGVYSDGPSFHFDYYNSFVILPLLLEILWAVKGSHRDWDRMYETVLARAQRHAIHLERLIGPDGTFPPVGRSLSYRCGAFHLLALLAWKGLLPSPLKPAQVREALIAVIERTLGAQQNFDNDGFLQVGLSGSQSDLAEGYISTGSLYLCSTAFLPLGLPSGDAFWTDPEEPWTQRRLWWLNEQIPRDQALKV